MTAPNPYRLDGPALVSFSGGRTSAFMVHEILGAFAGRLPADIFVCFANTGKEREETLRFVHEVGSRWGVDVHWLEYRARPLGLEGRRTPWADRFNEAGFNSASRNGEPFRALVDRKRFVPNAVTRFCTEKLKVEVMKAFMLAQGFDRWTNAVGLRADEVRRIARGQARNDSGKERFTTVWPMLHAGVTKRDIWKFWLGGNADPKNLTEPLPQGFDLGLYPYEGNCDCCFLKSRTILEHTERDRPGSLDWWIGTEAQAAGLGARQGARFVTEYSYADLKEDVARQPLLIPLDRDALEFDAECGVGGTDHRIRCGRRAA